MTRQIILSLTASLRKVHRDLLCQALCYPLEPRHRPMADSGAEDGSGLSTPRVLFWGGRAAKGTEIDSDHQP